MFEFVQKLTDEQTSAIISVIAIIVAIWGVRTASAALRVQSSSTDAQTVLNIWAKLDGHWIRFRTVPSKDNQFEFGQLVGYYELACGLFRDQVLTTGAARTLEEHLDEILPVMQANQDFLPLFEACMSGPKTYANIKWFCNRRKGSRFSLENLRRTWNITTGRKIAY